MTTDNKQQNETEADMADANTGANGDHSQTNQNDFGDKDLESDTPCEDRSKPDTDIASEGETLDELKDQLLRALADNENLRRRTTRDLAAAKKYGALSLARDLLNSADNLKAATALIPEDKAGLDENLKNLLIGVEMSTRELVSVLERHDIASINPQGEKFDYNFHQAMFEVETAEAEPGTIMQVVQTGYRLHDRLLRPAMVGVAKAMAADESTAADTQPDTPSDGEAT